MKNGIKNKNATNILKDPNSIKFKPFKAFFTKMKELPQTKERKMIEPRTPARLLMIFFIKN
ncbi:MAG: hypothetical protein RIR51_2006 [Bacteroidota bacterium]